MTYYGSIGKVVNKEPRERPARQRTRSSQTSLIIHSANIVVEQENPTESVLVGMPQGIVPLEGKIPVSRWNREHWVGSTAERSKHLQEPRVPEGQVLEIRPL